MSTFCVFSAYSRRNLPQVSFSADTVTSLICFFRYEHCTFTHNSNIICVRLSVVIAELTLMLILWMWIRRVCNLLSKISDLLTHFDPGGSQTLHYEWSNLFFDTSSVLLTFSPLGCEVAEYFVTTFYNYIWITDEFHFSHEWVQSDSGVCDVSASAGVSYQNTLINWLTSSCSAVHKFFW